MADVRLTATNPEDSSVVPVACDASGRLLLEEQGQGPPGPEGPKGDDGQDGQDGKDGDPFSGNFADDVTFGGSATFAGGNTEISSDGLVRVKRSTGNGSAGLAVYPDNNFDTNASAAINKRLPRDFLKQRLGRGMQLIATPASIN